VVVVPSEYEGDGMVVIESIAQGFPLLLADNKDLRRFALPDVHYFKGQSELNKKIELGKKSNFRDYLVSPLIQEQVLAERSIEAVVQAWCDLLNNTSHASEGML